MRTLALLPTLVWVTVACANGDHSSRASSRPPGAEAREIAIAIDHQRSKLDRREWTATQPDGELHLTAFFDRDSLRLIRETLRRPTSGALVKRYYFDRGGLRYYESEGIDEGGRTHADSDSSKAGVQHNRKLALAFDAHGALSEVSHLLDEQPASIDSALVAGVVARATLLAAQAAQARRVPAKR